MILSSLNLALTRPNQTQGNPIVSEALAVLGLYGADAHLYIPGVGAVNGITANNYTTSSGTTASSVGDFVGLVLDAEGSVGSELQPNGDFSSGSTGWTVAGDWVIQNNRAEKLTTTANSNLASSVSVEANKSYLVTFDIISVTGSINVQTASAGNANTVGFTSAGSVRCIITAASVLAGSRVIVFRCITASTAVIDNVSIKEVSGIHARTSDATRPVLRQSAGLYSWQFNGIDDILNLDSVPFVMADDHLIVLGTSLSAIGSVDPFVLADSTGTASTKGLLKLGFTGGGNYIYAIRDDINTPTFLQSVDTGSINTPYVMSGRKSGTALQLRVNGVSKVSVSATIGTTTLSVASIGARNLTPNSNFVNGFIYPVIAIKGTVTDANRLVLEKFVGLLSGVTI